MKGFSFLARVFMTVKECLITNHAQELQEETLADLHHCLDQLTDRHADMEEKRDVCAQRAIVHFKASKTSQSTFDSSRELAKAKQFMLEKRRLQIESEKLNRNISLIQQQIDTIISSQLNMSVVDAMKQFNVNAVKLSIPAHTYDIETLEDQLAERASEITGMQQAMEKMTGVLNTDETDISDDNALLMELQQYCPSSPSSATISSERFTLAKDVGELTSDSLHQQFNVSSPSVAVSRIAGEIISSPVPPNVDTSNASTTSLTDVLPFAQERETLLQE